MFEISSSILTIVLVLQKRFEIVHMVCCVNAHYAIQNVFVYNKSIDHKIYKVESCFKTDTVDPNSPNID